MKRGVYFILLGSLGVFLIIPHPVHAVIPPDFIFNLGAQMAQFFSITVLFFSTIIGTIWHFFRHRFAKVKHHKLIIGLIVIGLLGLALMASYWYAVQQQPLAYDNYAQ